MKSDFASARSLLLPVCIRGLVLAAVLLATQLPALASVKPIGEYSNMRYTAEHAYGYTVQLWQDGNQFFGLFMSAFGLAGDTPTGLLEDVKFNPSTGALSFTARLTVGSAYLGEGRQEPTRDFFTSRVRCMAGSSLGRSPTQIDFSPNSRLKPNAYNLPRAPNHR
jgi:hypothetical protein